MTKQKPDIGLIYPFTSDKFMEAWNLWIQYKKEVHHFTYKGVFSAQMTLRKLTELSGGEEEKAIRIIEQSIMQQWSGLFPLHIPKIKENGEQQPKKRNPESKQQSSTLRERVQTEFNNRYGTGKPPGSPNDTPGV